MDTIKMINAFLKKVIIPPEEKQSRISVSLQKPAAAVLDIQIFLNNIKFFVMNINLVCGRVASGVLIDLRIKYNYHIIYHFSAGLSCTHSHSHTPTLP